MNKIDEDKIKILIHKLGLKYNLRDEEIKKIVQSPYKFTRQVISELDIKQDITEEEFNKLNTNFIYMYLGKLYTSFEIFNKFRNLKQKRWENKKT